MPSIRPRESKRLNPKQISQLFRILQIPEPPATKGEPRPNYADAKKLFFRSFEAPAWLRGRNTIVLD